MARFAALILILLAVSGCGPLTVERPSMSEEQARDSFTQITGIAWEENFAMVKHRDEHAGFVGDGEFAVVITVPQSTIDTLLESPPAWGTDWQTGPVDGDIGFHCSFIYSEAPGILDPGTEKEKYYGGAEEAREILSNTDIKWCAKQRGPDSMPWHNGNLLIIDPEKSQIWLSVWDF